jgi:dephospho-CoA kinase
MVEAFGSGIVAADGTLDRQAVADIVFVDADAKARLEAIVHPAVGMEIARQMGEVGDTDAVVVLDIPLLVEKGRDDLLGTIVVDVDPEVAVERLVAFRGFREEDARARMANQVDRETRLAKADFVIDNSGDLAELDREVDRCWAWIEDIRGHRSASGGDDDDR